MGNFSRTTAFNLKFDLIQFLDTNPPQTLTRTHSWCA